MRHLALALALAATFALGAPVAAHAVLVYECSRVGADLCIANDDGSGRYKLTTGEGTAFDQRDQSPSLAADGKTLAYRAGTRGLAVMDLQSQAPRIVKPGPVREPVAISRDGGFVAAPEQDQLCTYATASGDRECRGMETSSGHDWMPDGSLVVAQYGPAKKPGPSRAVLCHVAPPGGPRGCQNILVDDPPHSLVEPAVSPDGKHVAVIWYENGALAVYSLETGELVRQLTAPFLQERPEWSPDGSRIMFSRATEGQPAGLYSIPSNGSPGQEVLVIRGGAATPTLGPGPVPPPPVAFSNLTVAKSQKGTAVKGSLDITAFDTLLGAELKADSKLLSKSKLVRVGELKAKPVPAGPRALTVKLTSKARAALKARGRLAVQLTVSVQPMGASAPSTQTVKVTLKR